MRGLHRAGELSQQFGPVPKRFEAAKFARRLVAAALPARKTAAIVAFNPGRHHAAAVASADRNPTGADANGGIAVVAALPVVSIVAVPSDLNVDALGHFDAFGLGRSDER